ncbi:hypothetical protein BJ508DRAFT_415212 [Ascobolus immersus RN42]|uniref:Uncharacterized protein n=1 Tax=Ascobolus immersus RN42 TaxID=1160509 RepID=A0A3N4I3Z2_ASCIM|nr:hypothetical protein BJ508DRAFT_415212 [Ascobolus immersus RN42]
MADIERPSSRSSTWSYDEKHPNPSTYSENDPLPVNADVPPELERALTSPRHNHPDPLQANTYEKVSTPSADPTSKEFVRKPPSRKPTAQYGIDPVTGEVEKNAHGVDLSKVDWSGLTSPVGEKRRESISAEEREFVRKVPSRKPTAQYGFDPVLGGTSEVAGK